MLSGLTSFAATREEIFDRVVSAPVLYQAWRKVRANRGAAGVDAVSLQVFEERLHENLRELSRSLSSGSYQPMPARFVIVRKDDGRERELAILTVRDRVAQRAVLGRLLSAKVLGLGGLAAAGFVLAPKALGLYRNRFQTRRGTLQGSPISPLLTNFYMTPFDREMTGQGLRLIRYCDDFVIQCRTQAEADAALRAAEKALAERRLKLHPSKTSIVAPEGEFEFLGYFFAACVPQPWRFEKRSAHPPKDEVNALLSLSYTLLYNRMTAHLNMIGFDPYQGFFHQVRHGHAALASDLIEGFRPLVADALVLKLLRRKQLNPSDLLQEKGEYRMRAEASKIFFAEFESKLNSRRSVAEQGNFNLTYSQIMVRQAHQLARVVAGAEPRYQPFTVK